jgi:hypothetical protein
VSGKKVSYAGIRDSLMTGDILLFHGLGWESDIIRLVEMSQWSHVAMIVKVPEIEFPLIWESFPLKFVEDVILHKRKTGVRLVSLDERLTVAVERKLVSRVAIRHLKTARTLEMTAALKDFIAGTFHDLPYPSDWEMLVEFLRARFFREKVGSDEVQCAELIAETYKRMGLLPSEILSSSFMPKDFSSDGHLPLLKGAELGEEFIILLEGMPSAA